VKPLDRELSLEQAKKNAENVIDLLDLDYEVNFHGSKYGTTSCHLISRKNRELKYGSFGKGLTQQEALTGALFEALEHYFCMEFKKHLDASVMEIGDYYQSEALNDIPLSLVSLQSDKKIAIIEYVSAHDLSKKLCIPLALSNPVFVVLNMQNGQYEGENFSYDSFKIYSSTNGMSAGSTLNEAIIHSVCENIERRSFGEFLISVLGANKPEMLKLINKESLPDYLRCMLEEAERFTREDVVIIDITNKYSVPAYLAYIKSNNRYESQFGLGCSVYPELALKRAISEVLQFRVFSKNNKYDKEFIIKQNRSIFGNFEKDDIYTRFSVLKLADFIDKNSHIIKKKNCPDNSGILYGLEEYKNILLGKIKECGDEFYYASYTKDKFPFFFCINGFILPVDTSFLLSKGVKVSFTKQNMEAFQKFG